MRPRHSNSLQAVTPRAGSVCGSPRGWLLAWLAALLMTACGGGTAPADGAGMPTSEVRAEAVVFRGLERTPLRLPVSSIRAVFGYDHNGLRVDYLAGADWRWDGSGIVRTAGSRMPDLGTYGYVANSGSSFSFVSQPRNPPLLIPHQVYVDYSSGRPDRLVVPTPGAATDRLVVCLGDSITAGAHTIANYFRDTDDDSYCGLLRQHLGPSSVVLNPSVPGGTLAWVQEQLPPLLALRPQTIILAFGMNDHVAGAAALPAFEALLQDTVQQLRSAGVRVLLVGFFQQNTRWVLEDPAQTLAYNQALARVAVRSAVAFIDVRDAFARSAPDGQSIESRTGDFMHHPNNFGQRVYFSLLLPHFLTAPVMASTMPAFVAGLD